VSKLSRQSVLHFVKELAEHVRDEYILTVHPPFEILQPEAALFFIVRILILGVAREDYRWLNVRRFVRAGSTDIAGVQETTEVTQHLDDRPEVRVSPRKLDHFRVISTDRMHKFSWFHDSIGGGGLGVNQSHCGSAHFLGRHL